jgi:hypothetical protein
MATWFITYRDDRDGHEVTADKIDNEGGLLVFRNQFTKENNWQGGPFLYLNPEIVASMTLLDPTSPAKA